MAESPILPTSPAEQRGYRECPRCHHRIPWNQPVPFFFSLPNDCPNCGNEVQRLKREEERRQRAAERNAVEPIVSSYNLQCPHDNLSLSTFKPDGADIVFLECDSDGDGYGESEGCGYRYQTTNQGHGLLMVLMEGEWRAEFRAGLSRQVNQMVKQMRRAGISGHIRLEFPTPQGPALLEQNWEP